MSLELFVLTCRLTASFCFCTLLDICGLYAVSFLSIKVAHNVTLLAVPQRDFLVEQLDVECLCWFVCVPRVLNVVYGCHVPSEMEWEFGK